MDDFDYKAWAEYIKEILDGKNIQGKSILEMACGTGSLTAELLKMGYSVDAFDLSAEMLSVAASKLKKFKNYRLFNLNMSNFSMNKKYDVIVSACDSINYLLEDALVKDTFKRAYEHLNIGGVFIFDINSEYKLRKILGDNIFLEDREDVFYTWENHLDEDSGIVDFILTFFTTEDGITYQRFDEHHRERAYSSDMIMRMLREAGFDEIAEYEAFTFKEANDETQRINFVAVRNK
jgi:predicted TPR repeat methyltransferase